MKTHLYRALLLLGFLLLTACGGSVDETGTTNCTLDASVLGSCTLN